MALPKRFEQMALQNDLVFGFADIILGLISHKRKFTDSDFVRNELNKIIDPIIINYESFKINLNRNSSHNSDIFRNYLRGNYYDSILSQLLKSSLKVGDVFLGIGANNGFFSLVGANGIVWVFEPSFSTFERLNKNIKLNGFKNMESYNIALGNHTGIVTFYDLEPTDGFNS